MLALRALPMFGWKRAKRIYRKCRKGKETSDLQQLTQPTARKTNIVRVKNIKQLFKAYFLACFDDRKQKTMCGANSCEQGEPKQKHKKTCCARSSFSRCGLLVVFLTCHFKQNKAVPSHLTNTGRGAS